MDGHIHLKINMQLMHVLGVYDVKFKIMGYLLCFLTCEYIELALTVGDGLFNIVPILTISLLYTDTICKSYVCNRSSIHKLIGQIRDAETRLMVYKNEVLEEIYRKHAKWNYAADRILIWVATFTLFRFFVNPLLIQMSKNYVKEYDEYEYYYAAYACHILAGMVGGDLTVASDVFFVGLMTFAIGQIKILQYSFRNLKQLAMNLAKNRGMPFDGAVAVSIGYFFRMHKRIIKYIGILNNAMRVLMLFDFAIASLQMAMLGLEIVTVGVGWDLMFAVEYLLAMFVQLFLFYWHANEIILESSGIASAIWDSDWVDYSISVKKSLALVMLRAQKPLTLGVGPFYIMSTETALSDYLTKKVSP